MPHLPCSRHATTTEGETIQRRRPSRSRRAPRGRL